MSVAHVLAQANVGYHEQIWHGLLYRTGGELDYALGVVSARCGLVFLIRDPEQEHGRNTEVVRPPCLGDGMVYRELEDPRHRGHGVPDILPRGYEDRIYEVLGREPRLAHESPQTRRAPGAPQTLLWKCHIEPHTFVLFCVLYIL